MTQTSFFSAPALIIKEVQITNTVIKLWFKHDCNYMNELVLYATLGGVKSKNVFNNTIEFTDLKPNTNYEIHLFGTDLKVNGYSEGWTYIEFRDFLDYQFKTLPPTKDIHYIGRNETNIEIFAYSNIVALHVDGQERTNLTNTVIFEVKQCQDSQIKITTKKNGSPHNILSKRLTTCECPKKVQKVKVSFKINENKPSLKLSYDPISTKHQNGNILCGLEKYVATIGEYQFQTSETFLEISLCDVFHTEDVIVQGLSYEDIILSDGSVKIPLLKMDKIKKINVTFNQKKPSNWLEAKVIPIPNENLKTCKWSIVSKLASKIKPVNQFNSNLQPKHRITELYECSTYNVTVDIILNEKVYQTRILIFETPVRGKCCFFISF